VSHTTERKEQAPGIEDHAPRAVRNRKVLEKRVRDFGFVYKYENDPLREERPQSQKSLEGSVLGRMERLTLD